jgi:oxidase EvaA
MAIMNSLLNNDRKLHSIPEILSWISHKKSTVNHTSKIIDMKDVKDWDLTNGSYTHDTKKYFEVIGARITIENREVASWCQPMIKPIGHGLMVLLTKEINGAYHYLCRLKYEPGNLDVVEMAPTIHCVPDSYDDKSEIPYYEIIQNDVGTKLLDVYHSEEGGRFYQEQNRNCIIKLPDYYKIVEDENFKWLTLNQIKSFLQYNNYVNIQLRSIISSIKL